MSNAALLTALIAALPVAQDPAELDRALHSGSEAALAELVSEPASAARALVRAAAIATPEVVERLLELGAPIDAAGDDFGTTPLMSAVGSARRDVGRLLLERGAAPEVPDRLGDPALNWAAYMGDAEFVALLLEGGADARVTSVHGDALGIALRRGNVAVVDVLVAASGAAAVDARLAEVVAGLRAGSPDALAAWLAAGGDANARDAAGTPLVSIAAGAGSLAAVESLYGAGARLDLPDAIGFTALFAAVRGGHAEVVALLLAEAARADVVALPRGMSMTALFLAGETGQLECVRALVEAGAPLDAQSTMGQSALGWSLDFGQAGTSALLLDLGADTRGEDVLGRTHAAIARGAGLAALAERIEARAAAD